MRSLNRVELIGHLGADPELRYTQAGDPVASLSLATSESWVDKVTGERREQTEWHRCVLWRKLAEIARDYLIKGARVFVAGSLKTRKWQDQMGQDRYMTEIQVRDLILLERRAGQPPATPAAARGAAQPAAASAPPPSPPTDFDDEIPF